MILYLSFGLTTRGCKVLLAGMRSIIRLCLLLAVGSGLHTDEQLWKLLAKDPETIIDELNIDPFTRSYISCPTCYALYDPSVAPEKCTSKTTPSCNPCGEDLFKITRFNGNSTRSPRRVYLHQSLREWIGRFLSRPEVDSCLDLPYTPPNDGYMYDIWDGYVLQHFVAADGSPYINAPGAPPGNLRLAFGLGVDSFNPFGNRIAKKKVSSTGVYMICYNLPPDLRYLPENMYLVGVIPGPGKPSLEQINNALQPLVNDFLPFWFPGVRFSRTANHRNGRLVNAIVVTLVMDLLAARQVAGIGFPSHRLLCSCCGITQDDLENFDPSTWPPRPSREHIRQALAWRDAPDVDTQTQLASENGARYSALLGLPYWDPLEFTTIDTMHNHYLGLIQIHIREVWGVDINADDGLGESHPTRHHPQRPPESEMAQASLLLTSGRFSELNRKSTRAVLWHLCNERDLRRAGTKSKLMSELRTWVSHLNVVPHSADAFSVWKTLSRQYDPREKRTHIFDCATKYLTNGSE